MTMSLFESKSIVEVTNYLLNPKPGSTVIKLFRNFILRSYNCPVHFPDDFESINIMSDFPDVFPDKIFNFIKKFEKDGEYIKFKKKYDYFLETNSFSPLSDAFVEFERLEDSRWFEKFRKFIHPDEDLNNFSQKGDIP
jgi:hypothetical protein